MQAHHYIPVVALSLDTKRNGRVVSKRHARFFDHFPGERSPERLEYSEPHMALPLFSLQAISIVVSLLCGGAEMKRAAESLRGSHGHRC